MSAPPLQGRPTILSVQTSSPNLWNKALDTLSVELRNSLDLTKASHVYVLSRALKEAQEKRRICAQKSWTLKKRNGETIILRDVVEKIIVWVEKFIAVGDAAMQYDTAHAAPAWAAFRFVLQMAVNDTKVYGETIQNLEAVSYLITRYAILEELYLQRKSEAREKLEDMVVHLYAEILTFLAKARQYFKSSTRVRLAKSMVKFSEDEQMTRIRVLDGQISRLTEVFAVDIQMETAKGVASMHTLLTSLNEPIKRLIDHSSINSQALHESQRLQLFRWLSSIPFCSHHKRHSESRIPGSCHWLLDHDRYRHWRNISSSSVFLLHGIMGSGKTALASAVVDSFLQESSRKDSSAPIAYFYCSRNSAEPERSNPDEIMRSILRQLTVSHDSSSRVHESVLHEYERRQAVANVDGFEITKLQTADCLKLIIDTTAVNPATIVIDAVDEIQPSSRHVLLSGLTQIVQDSLSIVKVFVTSRDDSNIHALLSDALAVRIQNTRTGKDMNVFVSSEVSSAIQNRRMLNGVVSDSLRQDLINVLVVGAGEMFIWVVRQIENLCRMKTEADIRSAMRALPTATLNEIYEEDFARIPEAGQQARSYAIQVFSMLLCAQEALSPKTLLQAIKTAVPQQGETMTLAKIIDICSNLVVLDSALNVLRFAHISFQEFLEMKAEFAPHYVHRVAATTCLDTCLEGFPGGMETDLSPKDDFRHYSAIYWAEHCRITISDGVDHSVTSKMEEFMFDDDDVALGFIDWIQVVSKFLEKLPKDHALAKALHSVKHSASSPLFTACVFGLTPIIDILAHAPDYDWNQMNDYGQSGLYLAAAFNHRPIVQRLLQHNVQVNAYGGKFGHPLHAACFGGHASIVELLLGHGADPNLGPKSALEYALLSDHEDIALLLLDDRFKVSSQREYDSILQQAAETGFADVVQILQKKYASLYGDLGSSRCKAVEVAIFKGRMGVVERYMQKLSDPKVDMPKDAIATAALGGQDAMVRFMVEWGLDLNYEGVLGTPLRAASIMCHESTVRTLLRLGADLNVPGSLGAPLQAAAMRGHESVTKNLLSHGADVNSNGGLYGTALQAAAHRGHITVVEILLDAGADVHQGGFSRDAFHAASEGGHEGIVRLLLERGFKFPQDDYSSRSTSLRAFCRNRGRNMLREASPSRCKEEKAMPGHQPGSKDWRERASIEDFSTVIQKMRGAVPSEYEPMPPYREGLWYRHERFYALGVAAAKGHVTVVELLLSQLDKMGVPKSAIISAFKEACGNGHEKVVTQLLSERLELKDFQAALEVAASNGHLTVVNVLIDYEYRVRLTQVKTIESPTLGSYECDRVARTILYSGSREGHLPIFRRGQELVAQSCTDVASRHLYEEALTTAGANHKFDIVKALLESNLEFHLEELTNTLNSICAWGSERTLKILLQHDTKKVLGFEQYSIGLSQAAREHNLQVVVYWLEKHPGNQNLVVRPTTVIDVCGNGFMDILPLLIERIRRLDSFEKTLGECLQVASVKGHDQIVEYLIGEGTNVNAIVEEVGVGHNLSYYVPYNHAEERTRKLSALQAALMGFERFYGDTEYDASSHKRTVAILLDKGADPNGAERYERYPLSIAAEYCTVEIMRELIASGANVDAVTKEHGSALQTAAGREQGGLPLIKALLEANASISSVDSGKAAALNQALSFFGPSGRTKVQDNGKFSVSPSIRHVLSIGPGAVVKYLLANLPEEKANDTRYGLLAQMACMAGDQECVEILLQRGMDVNVSGHRYGTALQAAARVGNIAIVERLLSSGADVNNLQGVHGTALRAAVIQGHEDLVRILIAFGADVNLRYNDQGQSVLHLAVGKRNGAIFKSLLNAGADVNARVAGQQHIMIVACKHGDLDLAELLLASGVDVNVSGTKGYRDRMHYDNATPLHAACANGHLSVVRLLLDNGADFEKTNGSPATPLIVAIREKNLAAVRLLLDAGAEVNHAVDVTPLSEAAEHCKLEIFEELLSAGATIGDSSTQGNALARACANNQHMVAELLLASLSGTQYEAEVCAEAFSAAINCGDEEIVRLLLESGVPPSFRLLRQACAVGVLGVVRMLVDTGIDVNGVDGDDAPMLHVAASHSRSDIVQFLIDQGANVMLHSIKYGSPLIAALEGSMAPFLRSYCQPKYCRSLAKQLPLPEPSCEFPFKRRQEKPGYKEFLQCEQIVRSLFNAGAEVDTTIRKFGNALHLASYMGSEVIVRQLLERMEDVNIFGGYFETALIAGLKGDHLIIVEGLLDRGIEVNRFSPEHNFALHCACASGSKKLTQSLLDHGADANACDDRHGSALAAAFCGHSSSHRGGPYEEHCAIIDLLLHHRPKVQIRECELLAAASWRFPRDGKHFLSLFLRHDPSAVATEAVIVKAIQNFFFYQEDLRLLLEHDGGLGTTPAMVKAADMLTYSHMSQVTKILLQHRPLNRATAEILKSMSERARPEYEVISPYGTLIPLVPRKTLIEHGPTTDDT